MPEKASYTRRGFLEGIGVSALGVGATAVGAADAGGLEVIAPDRSETISEHLYAGETFENKLIDLRNEGAKFHLTVHGAATVRNVGFKGAWPTPHEKEHIIGVTGTSSNEEVVIENLYVGDNDQYTLPESSQTNGGITGIFVSPSHAGDLLVRNANIQWCPDNAIYASGPGNGSAHSNPGAGGTVRIEDSFARGCRGGHFRLGTDDSYASNCVADGRGMGRGYWGYYEHTEVHDCDFAGPFEVLPVVVGANAWSKGQQAEVTVSNSRFDGAGGPGTLSGSSAGSPQRDSPEDVEGVPLSAEDV